MDLLERAAELGAIEAALTESGSGRGSVVVVEAPCGLGKTALLRRASDLAQATDVTVLTARAAELESDFAFGVVRQLFEPVVQRSDGGLFAGAAASAAGLFGAEPAGAKCGTLYPVLNGLYWLLVNIAQRPTMIVVDDLQWADEPSLRFLGFLARRLEAVPVTIVVALRTGEDVDSAVVGDLLVDTSTRLLEPKALSPAAVATLVRQRLGAQADDEFCTACHATTGGNPLYLRELLRVLAAEPASLEVSMVSAAGPLAVRRHVAAGLRRQPSHVQRVATVIAVLGDDTEPALVARLAEIDLSTAVAAIDVLVQQGLLDHQPRPAYVHALVRDAVLALTPPGARGVEHERAASALAEAGESAERVASHLLRSTPAENVETVLLLLRAADEVRRRGAPESAVPYLKRARAEPPPPEYRSEVSRMLGNCYAYRLSFVDAETHLREAVALAHTPAQRALASFSLARFRNACGDPSEAVEILLRAVAELPDGESPRLAARLAAEVVGFARVDLRRRALLVERLAAYRRRTDRADDILAAHDALEAILSGQPAQTAAELALQALAVQRLTPDNSGLWVAIHALVTTDRLDEAEHHLEAALDYAGDRGMLLPVAVTRGYLARVALLRGDLAQARVHVEHGLAAAPGQHFALPLLQSTLVHLLIEDGQLGQADAVIAGALAVPRLPTSCLALWLLDARARLRAAQGDPAGALADAEHCAALYRMWGAERMLDVPWRLRAAEALRALGRTEEAAAFVDEHAALARDFGVPRYIGLAAAAAARYANRAEAVQLAEQAVAALEQAPAALDLARALEQLGGQLGRAGDRAASRRAVRRAAELALHRGASALATRLRAKLSAGGGRPPRIQVSGVHALTPSERQVATLAAERLTNRQIAERLYVTEKTVEAHLSRVYRKLRVGSRIQLADELSSASG